MDRLGVREDARLERVVTLHFVPIKCAGGITNPPMRKSLVASGCNPALLLLPLALMFKPVAPVLVGLALASCQASEGEDDLPPVDDHCDNGIKDANEFDVDCGGGCGGCRDGQGCVTDLWCESDNCVVDFSSYNDEHSALCIPSACDWDRETNPYVVRCSDGSTWEPDGDDGVADGGMGDDGDAGSDDGNSDDGPSGGDGASNTCGGMCSNDTECDGSEECIAQNDGFLFCLPPQCEDCYNGSPLDGCNYKKYSTCEFIACQN